MGIRVLCPNGHKLNLKASQAGKRGICPHCGAKFQIPAADAPVGQNEPAAPTPTTAAVAEPKPAPPPAPPSEVPWYGCPPSGGQYGPIRLQLLRQWLDEGRVTHDSLVWREGWLQWAPVQEALAELAPSGPPSKPAAWSGVAPQQPLEPREPSEVAPPSLPRILVRKDRSDNVAADVPAAFPPVIEPARSVVRGGRRRRRRSVQLVAWLTVAVVVLVIIFAWVLLNH